jgi:hypothetical protein
VEDNAYFMNAMHENLFFVYVPPFARLVILQCGKYPAAATTG